MTMRVRTSGTPLRPRSTHALIGCNNQTTGVARALLVGKRVPS
jgi:hypothetical protein